MSYDNLLQSARVYHNNLCVLAKQGQKDVASPRHGERVLHAIMETGSMKKLYVAHLAGNIKQNVYETICRIHDGAEFYAK